MNREIERYITTNYYELLKIAKKITKNHELTQDLLHEVILQLYNKEKIILREYSDEQMKYYIVSVIRINWHSQTSPFYYKIRKEIKNYVSIDEIYNLAAQSHVRISFDQPVYTANTVGIGTLNLLEATLATCKNAKIYQASSSEMFGNSIDEDRFQRESTPMNPVSPYGCAKVFGYNITRN
jgi:nucleoside-diphosphate-sugar epimerase